MGGPYCPHCGALLSGIGFAETSDDDDDDDDDLDQGDE